MIKHARNGVAVHLKGIDRSGLLYIAMALVALSMGIPGLWACETDEPRVALEPDTPNGDKDTTVLTLEPIDMSVLLPHPRIVNAHEHLLNGKAFEKYRSAARQAGIETTVFVGSSKFTLYAGDSGFVEHHANNRFLCEVAQAHRQEALAWVTFDPEKDDMPAMLGDYIDQGATGVKLYVGHGGKSGDGRPFHCMPLDDPRLTALYDYCQAHRIPILMHVNWTSFGAELDKVLDRYPDLPLIIPHLFLLSNRLDRAGELLDRYPNLMTDISFGILTYQFAGLGRISQNRDEFRAFMIRYQDRLLFGTDAVITNPPYKTEEFLLRSFLAYRQMLELDHYVFDIVGKDGEHKRAALNGLALPQGVVCKIYRDNFEAFLKKTSIQNGRILPQDGIEQNP